MKILVLGHNGMLGNTVYKYLNKKYNVEIIENSRWDSMEYKSLINQSDTEFIINCVGAIPQKKYAKEFYKSINIELPIFLETTGKKIIHPSTDCEFSGKLVYPKKYTKDDIRDADDDYGMSKAKISEIIVSSFINTKIIRTSIIGHEINEHFSLLEWFLCVDNNEIVNGYANYFWNGVTSLFWAEIVEKIILDWDKYGTITQVGTDGLHKLDLLKIISKIYNKPIKINEFYMDAPLNKMLRTDFLIPSIEEQLIKLKLHHKNQ